MKRLRKQDWLAEGFKILAEFAQDKLRILYLCERLGVTRGSFYHHFDSMGEYIESLMKAWQEENTRSLIVAAEKAEQPAQKMAILNQKVFEKNNAIEAAIRSWSFYNAVVKKHLLEIDDARIQYLYQIFRESEISDHMAMQLAKLEYATLIGVQLLYPAKFPAEVAELYTVHVEMMKSMGVEID